MFSNFIGSPQRGRSCFILFVWNCFWVVLACSSLLWLLLARPMLLCFLQKQLLRILSLENLLKLNFMLDISTKQGSFDDYKIPQLLHKLGSFFYYKAGQVVLQSRTCITNWDKYYKVRQVLFVFLYKGGRYYILQSMAVKCTLSWK